MRGWEREEAGNKEMSPGQEKGSLGAAGEVGPCFQVETAPTFGWDGEAAAGTGVTGQCWDAGFCPSCLQGKKKVQSRGYAAPELHCWFQCMFCC